MLLLPRAAAQHVVKHLQTWSANAAAKHFTRPRWRLVQSSDHGACTNAARQPSTAQQPTPAQPWRAPTSLLLTARRNVSCPTTVHRELPEALAAAASGGGAAAAGLPLPVARCCAWSGLGGCGVGGIMPLQSRPGGAWEGRPPNLQGGGRLADCGYGARQEDDAKRNVSIAEGARHRRRAGAANVATNLSERAPAIRGLAPVPLCQISAMVDVPHDPDVLVNGADGLYHLIGMHARASHSSGKEVSVWGEGRGTHCGAAGHQQRQAQGAAALNVRG